MTYNNTLQGRFVATGYPAAAMLFVSLLLWVAGYLFSIGSGFTLLDSIGLNFIDELFARALSLLACVCAALVLHNLYLFERRVPYLFSLFLWLLSVHLFLQPDYVIAVALLLFLLAVAQLISCCQETGQERAVFVAFAILSFSSLFLLQFVYLLPLFIAYLWVGNIFSVKRLFAALLGTVTPYWLLLGSLFVVPSLDGFLIPLKIGLLNITTPAVIDFALQQWLTLAMEILVLLVTLFVFFSSALPAKPLLRRRLLYMLIIDIYLLLLSFVVPQDYKLLLAWRLPTIAVMAAYVFSMNITRLSNIYFITLNIMWLAIAAACLWII